MLRRIGSAERRSHRDVWQECLSYSHCSTLTQT